jgi:RNA polymerase sigma factor (sigma-70 family)
MTIPIDKTSRFPSDLPELVAAAVSGNRAAWNSLVERFAPLVTSVIRRFRLTESDADDVRQNTWLRLVEHLEGIREPRALPGWIATTTRNEALRVLSARRRVEPVDPQVDDRLDTINNEDLAMNLLLVERRQAVRAGLAELRSEHRELLLLVSDPEISYRQISRRLGMPTGSIGPTRARCLQKLRDTTTLQALAS